MKRQRLVSPKVAHAAKFLPAGSLERLNATPHGKQRFRNLLLSLSSRKPIPEHEFRSIAHAAAERSLPTIKLPSREIYLRACRTPERNLTEIIPQLRKCPVLFFSGAKMEVDWVRKGSWDIDHAVVRNNWYRWKDPKRTKDPFFWRDKKSEWVGSSMLIPSGVDVITHDRGNVFRVVIRPSDSEKDQPGFSEAKRILDEKPIWGGPDFVGFPDAPELKGAVGYLVFSLNRIVPTSQGNAANNKKLTEPVAMIWTWQMRGIPDLPKQFQQRYKKWDMELLSHTISILRSRGIRYMALPERSDEFAAKPKVQAFYSRQAQKLRKNGFSDKKITLVGANKSNPRYSNTVCIKDMFEGRKL